MAVHTPICDFGWKPAPFRLKGVDGRTYGLDDIRGAKATLIMFICNHCPYVQAVIDRIARDARELAPLGLKAAAINSNDPLTYPEDDFARMGDFAKTHDLPFPYLFDETQQVARDYGAVCTPDFFGFNANLELQYRGRLDASGKNPGPPDARRDMFLAMKQIVETGHGPAEQTSAMGCAIKWRLED